MTAHRLTEPFCGPLAPEFTAFLAFREDLATCHPHLRVALPPWIDSSYSVHLMPTGSRGPFSMHGWPR